MRELNFLNELKTSAKEFNVAIEKPARRFNSSFIFTAPDCHHPNILQIMRRFDISDYEVFNPSFKREATHRKLDLERFFDPEIITREYLSHNETNIYIRQIVAKIRQVNPKIFVEIRDEGRTYEQRLIKSIFVGHKSKPDNPVIFIDAGIHAREWHARSMGLFILKQLVDEAALNSRGILFKASFVIVPDANPDGYEFSRAGDKMWRKTRRPSSSKCIGVDGNRNYDVHWYQGDKERDPCADVYRGARPFSEPETIAIKKIMSVLGGRCLMYISIHTFGNTIMYPYGYTTNRHPRWEQLHEIAQAGVDAVHESTGTIFKADQSGSRLVKLIVVKVASHVTTSFNLQIIFRYKVVERFLN